MTGSQRQAPDVLPLGAVRAALAAASAPAPGRPGDAYAPDNRAPVYPVPVGPPAGDQPGPPPPRAVRPGGVGGGGPPRGPPRPPPPPGRGGGGGGGAGGRATGSHGSVAPSALRHDVGT